MATRYVDPDATVGGDGQSAGTLSGTDVINDGSGHRPYKTLSAWEAALPGTLTEVETCICLSQSSLHTADTTAVSINGCDTTTAFYIDIQTDAAARHAGVWNTAKYRLEVSNSIALAVLEDNVRITGMQVRVAAGNANYQSVIPFTMSVSGPYDCRVIDCILRGHRGQYATNAIGLGNDRGTILIRNTIIYDFLFVSEFNVRPLNPGGGTWTLENLTVIGGYIGINNLGGTTTAKNVYVGGASSSDFGCPSGTLAKTNCASADTTADDVGGGATATDCIISKPVSTATFKNVTLTTEDYHLASGSALRNAGTDPGTFTTDIDGETRSAPWDIGADEYSAPPAMGYLRRNALRPAIFAPGRAR